jgi:hypothetical protein
MNSTVDERWLAPMSSVLSFEGARNLEISGELQGHDREIIIPVTETSEGPLETDLFADEAVSVSSDLLIDDRWILSAGVTPAQDAMAPVITEALCTDTLRLFIRGIHEEEEYVEGQSFAVDFSETLRREEEEYPLLFLQEDEPFTPALKLTGYGDGQREYHNDFSDFQALPGDSVRIHSRASYPLGDAVDNRQENSDNRRVPLRFETIRDTVIVPMPYTLEPRVIHLRREQDLDHSIIEDIPVLQEDARDNLEAALIGLVPDSLENVHPDDHWKASMTLLDMVGNVVYGPQKLHFEDSFENRGLYTLWYGENRGGRIVESTSYLAVFTIVITRADGSSRSFKRRVLVSIGDPVEVLEAE